MYNIKRQLKRYKPRITQYVKELFDDQFAAHLHVLVVYAMLVEVVFLCAVELYSLYMQTGSNILVNTIRILVIESTER